MDELIRVKEVYRGRIEQDLLENRYSLFKAGELYMLQRRETATIKLLKAEGYTSFKDKTILEVGCGRGQRLGDFLRWGARAANITGVELLEEFVAEAKENYPGFKIIQGSGDSLPFESESFDLVYQSTVFSSILNKELQKKIASEMLRVLKPDGVLLWYDFRYPNPKNKNVKPIRSRELLDLFPATQLHLKSVTLAPPLARLLAPLSMGVCQALEFLPFLRTHYLGALIKQRAFEN